MDRQSSFANIFQAANKDSDRLDSPQAEETGNANSEEGVWVSLSKIVPWEFQPRQYFDEKEIQSLAAAFKEHGFKGAINVRPKEDGVYEIVAGERRWRAANIAGLEKIRCFIDDFSDDQALDFALTENLNRADLSKLEETIGIMKLIEVRLGLSQEVAETCIRTEGHPDRCDVTPSKNLQGIVDILKTFGIELQTFRTRNLRSLQLPSEIKEAHLKGDLAWSTALELNKIKDYDIRQDVLQEVIDEGLSSREARSKVKEWKDSSSANVSGDGNLSLHLKLKQYAKSIKSKEKDFEPAKKKKLESLLKQIEELIDLNN